MSNFLRIGAVGETVKTIQQSLNSWKASVLPALSVDGIFGAKTDSKVREYQRGNSLSADGIVGPVTQESIQAIIGTLVYQVANVLYEDEAFILSNVVSIAQQSVHRFQWTGSRLDPPESRNPHSSKIAAAVQSGPEIQPGMRCRQGGRALQMIFVLAGAVQGANCPNLKNIYLQPWQTQANKKDPKAEDARILLNKYDLPAWCGIFAFYVYRMAGINHGGWARYSSMLPSNATGWKMPPSSPFLLEHDPTIAQPGWIGVLPYKGNHHFIVESSKGSLKTIDGNLMAAGQSDFSHGYHSTVGHRIYTYGDFKTNAGFFLRPNFDVIRANPMGGTAKEIN